MNDLEILQDYVERSTHWQEGGSDRHDALQALKALKMRMRAIDRLCDLTYTQPHVSDMLQGISTIRGVARGELTVTELERLL